MVAGHLRPAAADTSSARPFGPRPRGYLVYDATGHVFWQVQRTGVADSLRNRSWRGAPDSVLRQVLEGFQAYFGTSAVDASARMVTHRIEGEFLPRRGQTELATPFRFRPDSLILGADSLERWVFVRAVSEQADMSRVHVVEYDAEWPAIFEQVRAYVWPAVSGIALSVEHVGSTSVQGLRAKPVIDACIVVALREDVPACIERLAGIGYVHRGNLDVPDREAFHRPDHLPVHHLYLSPRDSLSLKNHLGFRDYLRSHPETAREYGELKASLARRFPADMDSYIAGKTEFILRILGAIGLDDDELAAIRRINQDGP